jgi:predicted permease
MTGIIVAIGVALRVAKLEGVAAGTFVHVATRANLSFVGLPVLFYIIDARHGGAGAALRSFTVLALAPYLLFQNVTGIVALLMGRRQPGRSMARAIARDLASHPLLISLGIGLACGYFGYRPPVFLDRSLASIGAIAAPIALVTIGASLRTISFRHNVMPALLATLIKIVLMPAMGWLIGAQCGLDLDQLLVVLIFLACPTGASSFSLVAEMGGDQAMASAAIVLSTILAVVPLALVLGVTT